jgi:adenosylcobinamide kinase / adenosylcobinamide-phosphate guanylyltransferase
MIIYITGGVRSGKSRFAQELALKLIANPVYLATAKVWDYEFKERVERHQRDRGPEWVNYEGYKDLNGFPLQDKVVVIDCVTLWLTNFFLDYNYKIEEALQSFKKEIEYLTTLNGTYIIVSNEIGMGVHAETEIGRKFTDLQGWANQFVAAKAEEAILMVSGIPLYLKQKNS